MKIVTKIFFLFLISIFWGGCQLDNKYSNLQACNLSYNQNYEDVITNIYISDGATDDNFVSI